MGGDIHYSAPTLMCASCCANQKIYTKTIGYSCAAARGVCAVHTQRRAIIQTHGSAMRTATRLVFLALTSVCALAAVAQDKNAPPARPPVEYALFATPVYQFESGLDSGGEYSVTRLLMDFGATTPISRKALLTLSVNYEFADYRFSGSSGLGSVKPWDDAQRLGLTPRIFLAGANRWNYIVAPTLAWSAESGADLNDAIIYGLTFGAARTVSPRLTIGPAFGAFSQLEETIVFPFLFINWKITDRLTLGNPFRAGPAGPGGLELVYAPNEIWEFAGGGAARAFRFRLDDQGPAPDGVGEQSGVPLFVRIAYKLSPHFKLDFYAGAIVGGQLSVENSKGDLLVADDYDTAPIAALTFAARF
jgi:hypothetical protein